MLCCVDDAQWLDPPSAEALVFAARRFQAEPIALLMAARVGDGRHFDAPGWPSSRSAASTHRNAHALLSARLDRPVAPRRRRSPPADRHGNPLALLELPSALSAAQLDGVEPIVGPPPVRGAVEAAFGARVADLPDAARRVLLLAAADEAGDVATSSAPPSGWACRLADLDAAEREELVHVDGTVTFRHPLVRSAVYRAATRSERREAHEALAAAVGDPVSGAWHCAVVADRPDEALAGELEAAAAQAIGRTAHATAAVTFERAADLSEDDRRAAGACAAPPGIPRRRAPGRRGALVERARRLTEDPGDAGTSISSAPPRPAAAARRPTAPRCCAVPPCRRGAAPELATELALWSLFTGLQGGWDQRLFDEAQAVLGGIDQTVRSDTSPTTWSMGCPPRSPGTPQRPASDSPPRWRPAPSWTA